MPINSCLHSRSTIVGQLSTSFSVYSEYEVNDKKESDEDILSSSDNNIIVLFSCDASAEHIFHIIEAGRLFFEVGCRAERTFGKYVARVR